MKVPLLAPALVLSLLGSASAADYSKTLWSYVTGSVKATPVMDSRVMGSVVMKLWAQPPGLPVDAVMLIYMPKISQAHWAVMVVNPAGRAGDIVGAQQLTFVRVMTDPKRPGQKMNVFRVEGGMFRNMYVSDGVVADKSGQSVHMLMLMTPQMMDEKLNPQELLK